MQNITQFQNLLGFSQSITMSFLIQLIIILSELETIDKDLSFVSYFSPSSLNFFNLVFRISLFYSQNGSSVPIRGELMNSLTEI